MDTIYDTLAKLNKVANAPEIVKEDNQAMMKKGLEDLMKKTKFNKQADYKPFGKGDKDYETGLPKDAKKDKMFDDMKAADAAKMNKQSTYKPFGKDDPDYETGLPKKGKDGKMFEGPGGQTKHELIRQLFKTHFGQPQYNELTGGRSGMRRLKIITGTTRGTGYEFANDGPGQDTSDFEKAIGKAGLSGDVRVKSNGTATTVLYPDAFRMQSLAEADLVEKESDVERDDRAEKAGREVARDVKYDDRRHPGRDGKDVTKDIEYDEKHDKDGMHEAQGYDDKEDESLGMRTGKESGKKQSMKDRRDDSYGKFGKRDKEHADGKMHVGEDQGYDDKEDESLGMRTGKEADKKQSMKDRRDDSYGKFGKRDKEHEDGKMHMGENAGTLKDAARQGVLARLAELAGVPAQEIEEALGTPQDIADKIMSENPIEEAEVEEGNEFSGARDDAIKAGKDSFEVDGKTYPVKGDKNESIEEDEEKLDEDGNKKQMQDVEEGMSKEEFEKEYPGQGSTYDKIKKELEEKMDESTVAGNVSPGADGKSLYKNASIYENNEIVKRARELNEDMSVTVSAGTDAEPNININASGEDAAKMAELCKLAGIGMMGMGSQSPYGEVQIAVAEDQEYANGADDTETMSTEYMTQDIAGGLNGPKKMAYPKVAGGDNPMAVLEEKELNEVGEKRLMKLYQEYKAK